MIPAHDMALVAVSDGAIQKALEIADQTSVVEA